MSDFRASKSEKETAIRWTNFNSDNLLKTGEDLFALPCDRETYSLLYGNLKVVKPGTRIFSLKKSDFIPSHELALSSALKVNAFPLQEITLREAVSFLKRDSLSIFNAPKGWNLVTFRRVNIGFVNNIGNRLNNYYPVEWRIRMDIPGTFDNQIIKWHENGNESQ